MKLLKNGVSVSTEYKKEWEKAKKKFAGWWENSNVGRPLMDIVSFKDDFPAREKPIVFDSPEDHHTNVKKHSSDYHYFCQNHTFHAEAFPNLNINLGAGSMAAYLGTNLKFAWDTIWFEEWIEDGVLVQT